MSMLGCGFFPDWLGWLWDLWCTSQWEIWKTSANYNMFMVNQNMLIGHDKLRIPNRDVCVSHGSLKSSTPTWLEHGTSGSRHHQVSSSGISCVTDRSSIDGWDGHQKNLCFLSPSRGRPDKYKLDFEKFANVYYIILYPFHTQVKIPQLLIYVQGIVPLDNVIWTDKGLPSEGDGRSRPKDNLSNVSIHSPI